MAATWGFPVILSSGLADLDMLADGAGDHSGCGSGGVARGSPALRQRVSRFPRSEANLRAIGAMQGRFAEVIGYSDHTLGVRAAVLAAALGARIIEKHFTIAHDYSAFRDHAMSATPAELSSLVEWIHHDHRLLGDGAKTPQACELRPGDRRFAGRSGSPCPWRPARDHRGRSTSSVSVPGDGLAPGEESRLTGRARSLCDVNSRRGDSPKTDLGRSGAAPALP